MSMGHFLVSSGARKSIARAKSRLRVAKLHRKILNRRKYFLHKLSYYFVANYKNIVIENL